MKILVIIPAFNEEGSIERVVSALKAFCSNVDYLIINDCSTDATKSICEKKNLRHINLPINLGIGGGVQTGYQYAVENNYDIAVQLDGDGQHNPKDIPQLIQPILDGEADLAIGSRFLKKNGFQSSFQRRVGIRFLKDLIRLCCGITIQDTTSGFRACGRQMTAYFARCYAEDYPEPEAIVRAVKNGFRIKEVPVVMSERKSGTSSIHAGSSLYYMIKVSIAILIDSIKGKG